MRSLDELRPDREGPTLREMIEESDKARRELERAFPDGVTMYSEKPEDPSEGDMYVEPDGQMMIYTGDMWKKLVVPAPPRAMGGPVRTPWDPSTHTPFMPHRIPEPTGPPPGEMITVPGDPDAREPRYLEELLEVLLCPECDFELGSRACGPVHAFLAENPMNHRLLKPLLERYQEEIRWAEGKQCSTCLVPLASAGCTHSDVRGDQVLMSRETYDSYLQTELDLRHARGELDKVEAMLVKMSALGLGETEET